MTRAEASWENYTLEFIKPARTSRDTLATKPTWFLQLTDKDDPSIKGLGECSPIWGLSIDTPEFFEKTLNELCAHFNEGSPLPSNLSEFPAIECGLEMALLDLQNGGVQKYFDSPFYNGEQPIRINGLVWMGSASDMKEQISQKLELGFRCLKLKIGSLDWLEELSILQDLRTEFGPDVLELRVDANGSFSTDEVDSVLHSLSVLDIHSIEQPIKQGQLEEMASLCQESAVPIALDEELIGIANEEEKRHLIESIRPQYLILKPSLLGGFRPCMEWIKLADENSCRWWVTSALESNVGLNAIAQWTATLGNPLPQGLGTGQLYKNNVPSPLRLEGDLLYHDLL
jgi:o-succinylbenzoate synthase